MSHSIDIFVDTPLSLEGFVRELQSLLEVEFELHTQQFPTGLKIWYEAHPPGIWLDAYKHHLESYEGMPYEQYPLALGIRGAIDYWVERERRLYEYTAFAFGKLKEQGKYPLMLTDDEKDTPEMFTPDKRS